MKRTTLGLILPVLALLSVGCGGDDNPASTSAEDTTDTSGDGDGDPGDGDGDGDPGDGDGDPTGEADMDMDGVGDTADNCPDIPNPNQLDYDDNGAGNVCDTQMFMNATGMLNTTASAAAVGNDCNIPLQIMVTGGQVMVQLDDDAAMAGFEIANLQIADILDQECDLGLATATVSMTNFMMTNSGGPFPVGMPHSLMMHDAGQIAGMSDVPHPVLSTATMTTSVDGGEPMMSDLMLDGSIPTFTANIMGGGASGTISFADPDFVLAMDQFETDVMGFPITIDFELRGLVGTVTLAP